MTSSRRTGCGSCGSILEDVKRYERLNRSKARTKARSYSSSSSSILVPALIALGAGFTIAAILVKK